MTDILLLILGICFIMVGFIGCMVPVLPGPPISFLGMLCLEYSKWGPFHSDLLWTFGFLAIAVTVLDYIVPIWGTKKLGGSRIGLWGAAFGLLIGLFFGPFGVLVGPFLGAFIGELSQKADSKKALKAAFGAFLGLLMGVGLKLTVSGIIALFFFKQLFFE
ncbi:MAG: DUF456 domain-containing protein [Salinivirgaceae bacterium]|jgi:uncharacterized protein YqgC (DUF456 family)|nr:DUF456 domain-containing protein [Salinivirgaceae bacterium]